MLTIVGYYDWQSDEKSVSEEDFFVHCCGRYRLVHLKRFQTERPQGSDNYQLLYIAGGQARFVIEGEMHILEKGDCVLYSPGDTQYYYYHLEDHPDVYWIHFSCMDKKSLKKLGWGEEKLYHVGVFRSYIQIFDGIIQELQLKQPYCEDQLKLMLQQLLLMMGRNRIRENSEFGNYNKEVEEAIRYFNKFSEGDYSIKQFTKERGLNYYRFIDTFTQQVGTSPRQYIINIRMTKAKDLLINSLLSISEIAQLTGYVNPLYFSRLFKKTWGMSPTEYKKYSNNNK